MAKNVIAENFYACMNGCESQNKRVYSLLTRFLEIRFVINLVDILMNFREYSRKKRGAFRISVQKGNHSLYVLITGTL